MKSGAATQRIVTGMVHLSALVEYRSAEYAYGRRIGTSVPDTRDQLQVAGITDLHRLVRPIGSVREEADDLIIERFQLSHLRHRLCVNAAGPPRP
jgi:hypothetical protein